MNLSRLTALIIQSNGNEIVCSAGKSPDGPKWIGWIWYGRRPLINTDARYDTEDDAIDDMKRLVANIRAKDLTEATTI